MNGWNGYNNFKKKKSHSSRFKNRTEKGSDMNKESMYGVRLMTAESALKFYLETGMEITRNGSWAAVMNVIAPATGKNYLSGSRLTKKGKREAFADCGILLRDLETQSMKSLDELGGYTVHNPDCSCTFIQTYQPVSRVKEES